MKFEITPKTCSLEKVKMALDEFIKKSEEEYNIQVEKARSIPLPSGYVMPSLPPLVMTYTEENTAIIFMSSVPIPKNMSFLLKLAVKKARKNLVGFLKEMGMESEVKYLGE